MITDKTSGVLIPAKLFHFLPSLFLQVGACAYLNKLQINYCWLIQTFAMYCTIPGYEVGKWEESLYKESQMFLKENYGSLLPEYVCVKL